MYLNYFLIFVITKKIRSDILVHLLIKITYVINILVLQVEILIYIVKMRCKGVLFVLKDVKVNFERGI